MLGIYVGPWNKHFSSVSKNLTFDFHHMKGEPCYFLIKAAAPTYKAGFRNNRIRMRRNSISMNTRMTTFIKAKLKKSDD